MLYKSFKFIGIAALLVLTACLPANLPAPASSTPATVVIPPDLPATIAAAAQSTLSAIATSTALAQPVEANTNTPEPPTATVEPSATLPPPTQAAAMVHVVKDTNCRRGPNIIYDYLGALMVGEQAEMIGRLSNNNWWVIKNLDAPGECWITGQFATPEGPYQQLPIRTPPPTPTPTPYPALELSFASKTTCGADTYYVFGVKNAGTSKFESSQVSLTNNTTHQSAGVTANSPFWPQAASCGNAAGSLAAGKTAFVAVKLGGSTGNAMSASVTLCTQDDLKGTCVSQGVNFTSP